MQNLLCKMAGKKEAYAAMKEKSKFWNFQLNGYIQGTLDCLEKDIEELEEASGLKAPVRQNGDNVVQIQHRRLAR